MNRPLTRLPELEDLKSKTTNELTRLWCRLYGTIPPQRVRRETILRFVAYRVQELKHGGSSESSQALLRSVIKQIECPASGGSRELLYPGIRLVRDWRGERHEVKVLQGGFEYRGERYKSLSALAKFITGTKRSGPLFFGLREAGK